MKFIFCLTLALSCLSSFSQTIWDGPTIRVSKVGFADITLPENQDSLTQNVILVRGDSKGFYNIAKETTYTKKSSPVGTEWARGKISDGIATLTFQNWEDSHGSSPISTLGRDMVVHLIDDDIYLDFKLVEWAGGQGGGTPGGGSFVYERSTPNPTTSLAERGTLNGVKIYPNPASSTLTIKLPEINTEGVTLELINGVGQLAKRKLIHASKGETTEQVDVSDLANGIYLVRITSGEKVYAESIVVQ